MGSFLSGTKGNSFSGGYFVDGKIYHFSTNNTLIYDVKNDAFQTVKSPQNIYSFTDYVGNRTGSNGSGRSFAVIGKTIYTLSSNAIVSLQVP